MKELQNDELETLNAKDIYYLLFCPLSKKLLNNPVMTEYGTIFEKEVIEEHMKDNDFIDPFSKIPYKTKILDKCEFMFKIRKEKKLESEINQLNNELQNDNNAEGALNNSMPLNNNNQLNNITAFNNSNLNNSSNLNKTLPSSHKDYKDSFFKTNIKKIKKLTMKNSEQVNTDKINSTDNNTELQNVGSNMVENRSAEMVNPDDIKSNTIKRIESKLSILSKGKKIGMNSNTIQSNSDERAGNIENPNNSKSILLGYISSMTLETFINDFNNLDGQKQISFFSLLNSFSNSTFVDKSTSLTIKKLNAIMENAGNTNSNHMVIEDNKNELTNSQEPKI